MKDLFDALLVVDVQNGFMKHGADHVVAPISELVDKMPIENVIYLRYRNYAGSFFTRHLQWDSVMTGDEIAIVPAVYREGGRIFDHYSYLPSVEALNTLRQFQKVAICGVDTDACVMAAFFALWDAEISSVILADYCASSGGESFHEAALDLMRRQFGTQNVLRIEV